MRRKDREITDFSKITDIIKSGEILHIAINGEDGYPYLLPFNYGAVIDGDSITLYIHGAYEGRKNELLKRDNRVGFNITTIEDYREGSITSFYGSVCGKGTITEVEDYNEKFLGLSSVLEQYGETRYKLDSTCVSRTNVLRLNVEEITGKKHE